MKRQFLAGLLALPALVMLAFAALNSTAQPTQAATFAFQTDMYGTENVPAVDTVAYGFVRFFFNETRSEADYNVDVKGYSTSVVTSADIHRGARGVNGPVVKHLADGGFIVTGGHMKLSADERKELEAGLWYISLKTVDHPDGVLRGQIILPLGFDPDVVAPAPPIGEQLAPADLDKRPTPAPAPPPPPVVVVPPLNDVVLPGIPTSPDIDGGPSVVIGLPPSPPSPPVLPVPELGPIRPPNTGDGGLLGR